MGNSGDDRKKADQQKPTRAANNAKTPLSEWVVAGAGLVLVAGSLGYLAYAAVAKHSSPPDIIVQSQQVVPMTEGYLLRIQVVNRGGATVSNLKITGRLVDGAEVAEESETTFDYVPSDSQRKGGLFFRRDPRDLRVELRAGGYQEP